MRKGQKVILSALVLVLVSSGSFFMGNRKALESGDKVIVNKEEYEIFSKLSDFTKITEQNFLFDIDYNSIKNSTYKGFFKGLNDPYTEYLTKEEYDKMSESTSGEYSGIGIYVTVTEDNLIKVVSPIKGSPAIKAGIKPDDIIAKINGEVFLGEQLNEAVAIMKGKPGDEVVLGIRRVNSDNKVEDLEMKVKIDIVELTTVDHSEIDKLGYISISQFGEKTFAEFETAYNDLKTKDVEGIILDLRNNPGGLKDSCVEIADFLLPEGPIVKTVDKHGKKEIDESDSKEENLPMVVIVNNGTASASEILSGAIKDYNKGTIIGTTTYGKGLVQHLVPLKSLKVDDDGALKITVEEYFTPKDIKINKIGVKPDKVVEISEEVKEYGPNNLEEDTQLQEAMKILKENKK